MNMKLDGKKILIIEDENLMSQALSSKFKDAGFDVKSAQNGENGLALLEKENFDIILLDLVMPKLDGFKVLEMLKEKCIDTPVVVVTNLSQPEDEKRTRELGVVEFIVKSNTPISEIVERVSNMLNI